MNDRVAQARRSEPEPKLRERGDLSPVSVKLQKAAHQRRKTRQRARVRTGNRSREPRRECRAATLRRRHWSSRTAAHPAFPGGPEVRRHRRGRAKLARAGIDRQTRPRSPCPTAPLPGDAATARRASFAARCSNGRHRRAHYTSRRAKIPVNVAPFKRLPG